jgi:hypothetical protein
MLYIYVLAILGYVQYRIIRKKIRRFFNEIKILRNLFSSRRHDGCGDGNYRVSVVPGLQHKRKFRHKVS